MYIGTTDDSVVNQDLFLGILIYTVEPLIVATLGDPA